MMQFSYVGGRCTHSGICCKVCPHNTPHWAIFPSDLSPSLEATARCPRGGGRTPAERYEAHLQPDGAILVVLANTQLCGLPLERDNKSYALAYYGRCVVCMHILHRDMPYLLLDLNSVLSWADVVPWPNKLSAPAKRGGGV